mmetsp:Transcript_28708/g.65584  ORF Transcript_28708/g.65584 Transcript_28708/m.65584 type:complete len:212 (+) Transcript_28708:730-1365(+)
MDGAAVPLWFGARDHVEAKRFLPRKLDRQNLVRRRRRGGGEKGRQGQFLGLLQQMVHLSVETPVVQAAGRLLLLRSPVRGHRRPWARGGGGSCARILGAAHVEAEGTGAGTRQGGEIGKGEGEGGAGDAEGGAADGVAGEDAGAGGRSVGDHVDDAGQVVAVVGHPHADGSVVPDGDGEDGGIGRRELGEGNVLGGDVLLLGLKGFFLYFF